MPGWMGFVMPLVTWCASPYLPEEQPEMFTIGGVEMFDASSGEVETKDMPHDVNRGRHILHTGGCFDGYLYLSVSPFVLIRSLYRITASVSIVPQSGIPKSVCIS